MPSLCGHATIFDVADHGGKIYAATDHGLASSSTGGLTCVTRTVSDGLLSDPVSGVEVR